MKRVVTGIIGVLSCCITLYAQNSDDVTGNYSDISKRQLQVSPVMSVSELNPLDLLPRTVLPFSYEHNAHAYFKLRKPLRLKHFHLSTFNSRLINWGVTDINNVGIGILWQGTSKISMEWSNFISRQYGYNLNSTCLSFGTKMNLNYHFNNKLRLSLWGQYLINQNTDPFIKLDNSQPKNGIGLILEYSPNINTKYSIGVSEQDIFINSRNSFIQVEGKAGFKF